MNEPLKAQAREAPEDYSPGAPAQESGGLAGSLRQFLHQALRSAHDAALERLAEEDSAALDAPKPVRAAVYRSVRRLRLEEDNLRYKTVENLVESVLSSLGPEPAKGASPKKLLSLMNEEELEDSVLILSLAAAADAHCAYLRRSYLEAFGKKLQRTDVTAIDTALSPRGFLEHYFESAKPLELEPELRIALLESFEIYVLRRLPSLYDMLAEHLGVPIQNDGFRPASGTPGRAGGGSSAASDAGGGGGGNGGGVGPGPAAWTEAVGNEVVTSLLEALAGRARSSRSSTTPEWPRDRLLACLTRLQSTLSNCVFDQLPSAGGLAANVEAELRRIFADDKQATSRTISDVDTAVADLVDMIFDYVVDSQSELAKERKVPLGTLRVPYYRVALLDRQLFIKREHPARRLLEKLPNYGVPTDASGADDASQGSLISLVQRIHREFDGSMEVFERIFADLDRGQKAADIRMRTAERRLVQHAEGRERLAQAWQETVTLVHDLIAEYSPPRLVRDLLGRPWAQFIVLSLLKPEKRRFGGLDPRDVAKELCRTPDVRDGGTSAMATRHLSGLAKELKHGLVQVGYSDQDVVAVWRDLVSVLVTNAHKSSLRVQRFESIQQIGHSVESADRELLRGIVMTAKTDPAAAPAASAGEAPADSAEPAGTPVAPRPRTVPTESARLEGATLGEWYVETRTDADPLQHKLVWFGKFVDRYLFVDRSGRKTIECSGPELRELMSSGRLTPVVRAPQVEVAIMSIFDKMTAAAAGQAKSTHAA